MMYPQRVIEFCGEVVTEWWFWVTLLVFGMFLHLTALLSLFVKWGALPLAIGMMFFGMMFVQMGFGLLFMWLSPSWLGDGDIIAAMFVVFFLVMNIGMEILIGLRLRQLAER